MSQRNRGISQGSRADEKNKLTTSDQNHTRPFFVFEVSWEVCNMVGGIHTVLASKAPFVREHFGDDYIAIGPYLKDNQLQKDAFIEEVWDEDFAQALKDFPYPVKIGRWKIEGRPRCCLIDFTSLSQKIDAILFQFWEKYQLDSLSGGFDYKEPVLFSYAVGEFVKFYDEKVLVPRELRSVVHCHEWMSGGAILYLRNFAPQIATIFTTHATMLGRALASKLHLEDLYTVLPKIEPERQSHNAGVRAKFSMESTLAKMSDVFTTVSDLTAEECDHLLGHQVDFVVHNGFKPFSYIDTKGARQFLLKAARATTGFDYDDNKTKIFITSGRYEFKNKGIDLLVKSLSMLKDRLQSSKQDFKILAYVTVPAGCGELRSEIMERFQREGRGGGTPYRTTHILSDEKNDPLVQALNELGLFNSPEDPVHIIFVPIYLNGFDPLFTKTYYQLLPGADLTFFPSFYEPWGYTPQESIACAVPTVTSDLAGFGVWAQDLGSWDDVGVQVLHRRGQTFSNATEELTQFMQNFLLLPAEKLASLKQKAFATAAKGDWNHFFPYYLAAYQRALQEADKRSIDFSRFNVFNRSEATQLTAYASGYIHTQNLKVIKSLSVEIEDFCKLAKKNISWSWNQVIVSALADADFDKWYGCGYDVTKYFQSISRESLDKIRHNSAFSEAVSSWTHQFAKETANKNFDIAYFCMEYGMIRNLKIYSGGLGILAGDHLKTAHDENLSFGALGLAYQHGYFTQRISIEGHQLADWDRTFDTTAPVLPVIHKGEILKFSIPFYETQLWIRVWKVQVGSIPLYLLDTNLEENDDSLKALTGSLYGGNHHHRLKQEYLLGIGGYEFYKIIGIKPKVFHMNEGHSAFIVYARILDLMKTNSFSFDEALDFVRKTTIFTTHTPIPAGHDTFVMDEVTAIFSYLEKASGVPQERWIELGMSRDRAHGSQFSMTVLAVRGAERINGVSDIHGSVSRDMFRSYFPGYMRREIPVSSITNGVHAGTWIDYEWQNLFKKVMGNDWNKKLSDETFWDQVNKIDDKTIWDTHLSCKRKLIRTMKAHLTKTLLTHGESAHVLAASFANLKEDTLIFTFARRFAPYKRAYLLFTDLEKLRKILNGPRPVVFIFSGKAHPADTLGKDSLSKVVEVSRMPEFAGKIIFLENYELGLSNLLVAGSDVWLNMPTRPLEASGTSGMKAGMNGCINLSVMDGWWAESYNEKNGWALPQKLPYESQEFQDKYDQVELYHILEHMVIPEFYKRDLNNLPREWVARMRESLRTVIPRFSSVRMINDYKTEFYMPAIEDYESISKNNYMLLRDNVSQSMDWTKTWNDINFIDVQSSHDPGHSVSDSQNITIVATVAHQGLRTDQFKVQVVLMTHGEEMRESSQDQCVYLKIKNKIGESESVWEGSLIPYLSGNSSLSLRIVPNNTPFTLGTPLVKWL